VAAGFSAAVQTQPAVQWEPDWEPGVKRPGRGDDTHHHLAPRLKKVYSCTSAPPVDLRDLFKGDLYLYFVLITYLLTYLPAYLPTYLPTYSRSNTMEHILLKADSYQARFEILHILWIPRFITVFTTAHHMSPS
jgi:hypothetical protein